MICFGIKNWQKSYLSLWYGILYLGYVIVGYIGTEEGKCQLSFYLKFLTIEFYTLVWNSILGFGITYFGMHFLGKKA